MTIEEIMNIPNFHMMTDEEEAALLEECKRKHPECCTPEFLAMVRKYAEMPCDIPGLREC